MESGWRILRRDKYREVIKEVILKGPFVKGLASHVELRTFEPASYTLRMTLVQPSP
jgi:23S rRNA maturation-related 3'-5' exoribonuclease YhaM